MTAVHCARCSNPTGYVRVNCVSNVVLIYRYCLHCNRKFGSPVSWAEVRATHDTNTLPEMDSPKNNEYKFVEGGVKKKLKNLRSTPERRVLLDRKIEVRQSKVKSEVSDPLDLRKIPYAEYLTTQHWIMVREKALVRACYRCQVCYSPNCLQVHHRTYERRGKEWMSDLTVLCSECHKMYHSRILPPDAVKDRLLM